MNNFDYPKLGDYVTIHNCENFKTTCIVISCEPLDGISYPVVRMVYTAECEMLSTLRSSYGHPIWNKIKARYAKAPYICSNFRTENIKSATEAERSMTDIALAKLGVIWNHKTKSFDDRGLPDISNGLVLNEDSKYCWHKVLKPYIGKVFFEEREDSQNHPYESDWAKIWNILLKEKLKRQNETGKRSDEMEEHMFEVLRTIYQAPLLKVSYEYQNRKEASNAFLIAEKNNRYEEGRGFVIGEPKLHLVTDMVYLTCGVCRIDLYERIKKNTTSDIKLYFPNEK